MKTLLLLLLLPFPAMAEVISASADGFIVKIERQIDVKADKAYQQFVQVDEWWIADHTYFGNSQNLSFDLRAGGCFCEIQGEKQVLHMTISYVNPGKEVRMVGGLGPLQMMGVSGGMSWKFGATEDGKTTITHHYQVSGSEIANLDKIASIVDKVQSMQVDSLVKRLSAN